MHTGLRNSEINEGVVKSICMLTLNQFQVNVGIPTSFNFKAYKLYLHLSIKAYKKNVCPFDNNRIYRQWINCNIPSKSNKPIFQNRYA